VKDERAAVARRIRTAEAALNEVLKLAGSVGLEVEVESVLLGEEGADEWEGVKVKIIHVEEY
jgi:hypothetical protein